MDKESFDVACNLINDKYQQELFFNVKQLQEKYMGLESKFLTAAQQLKTNIAAETKELFNIHNELILGEKNHFLTEKKISSLLERKKSLEKIIQEEKQILKTHDEGAESRQLPHADK